MTIKYWIYYLINNDNIVDSEPYAYTDKKKLAKKFEEQRNMDKFVRHKVFLTREELSELAHKYHDAYIELVNLDVYDKDERKWNSFDFAMSENEKLTIGNIAISSAYDMLYVNCDVNPMIFNDKIYKALCDLNYVETYCEMTGEDYPREEGSYNAVADTLAIFIRYYGKTLKGF